MPAALTSTKILLVLPSTWEKRLFEEALKGFELHFIHSLDEAAREIPASDYHLMIVDYHWSGMNGLDFIRKTRQSAETHPMPTILLLEEGFEKIAIQALKEGVTDYLTKSELVPSILRMAATRALEQKRWERVYQTMSKSEKSPTLKDPQTDLFNRTYFGTRLVEEVKRSRRYHFPLTLILLTIDQFEPIRERYGQAAFDAIRKEMGRLLQRNLRSSDLLATLKEDTFGLLLPHTSLEQTQIVWNRLVQSIMATPFLHKEENFYLTVKGAIVPLNTELDEVDALLESIEAKVRESEEKDRLFVIQPEKKLLPPSES